ncbi:MAG: hypothetical protein AAGJ83_03695, partial [Planctomycetota bacterium]
MNHLQSDHDRLRNEQRTCSLQTTRRMFFGKSGFGIGSAALASLLGDDARAETESSKITNEATSKNIPHHAAKAKRVIYLYMAGGPSQFET